MSRTALVIRAPSGISGDMIVAGLARLCGREGDLAEIMTLPDLPLRDGAVCVLPARVGAISGWRAEVSLPHEHVHRPLATILGIIQRSGLSRKAKLLATRAFERLADAEAKVHGIGKEEVEFHEVGALDSILDICTAAALLDEISPARIVCSPLPLCDGVVSCAHGLLSTPAPAVQEMLPGVPVYGLDSTGETVTPTALSFLLAAGAEFGAWPEMTVSAIVRIFGGRVLPGVANGAIFALGELAGSARTRKSAGLRRSGHHHHVGSPDADAHDRDGAAAIAEHRES